jgi:hypothetical protein
MFTVPLSQFLRARTETGRSIAIWIVVSVAMWAFGYFCAWLLTS